MSMNSNGMNRRILLSGSINFRIRVILSTLSGIPLRIKDIRREDADPGIREYEVLFLKLIQTFTSGTVVEINATGTTKHKTQKEPNYSLHPVPSWEGTLLLTVGLNVASPTFSRPSFA